MTSVDNPETRPDVNTEYHLGELRIALDPSRPEHILPDLSRARIGVVDVGCGIGQLFVAKAGELAPGVRCYGFDIDSDLIRYANEHWPDRAEFGLAPAEALPIADGAVDWYVSRVTLPYTDIPAALSEAARVLVPGGHLWITLHPLSMTLRELASAARRGRVKEVVGRTIVLLNGAVFNWFGVSRWFLGIRDSWQGVSRMERQLESDFRDVRINSGTHFLIEATRR